MCAVVSGSKVCLTASFRYSFRVASRVVDVRLDVELRSASGDVRGTRSVGAGSCFPPPYPITYLVSIERRNSFHLADQINVKIL
jgi:hypothetical protein